MRAGSVASVGCPFPFRSTGAVKSPIKKLALNVTLSQGVPEGQPGVGLAVTFFSLFFVVDLVAKRQENGKIIYVNT